MNNAVFAKTIKTLGKHRDKKLAVTERRSNYLLSEPNYCTTKYFTKRIISNRNEKIILNKSVYLGLPRLELSKILIYEFWYDYVKQKYHEKSKMLYGYWQFHCIHRNRWYL